MHAYMHSLLANMSGTVTLISADQQRFDVPMAVATQSLTIKSMVEEIGGDDPVPVPNVNGAVLARVIEFCTFHTIPRAENDDARKQFDTEYTAGLKADHGMLFDLILAANYLNIKQLLDLVCSTVAGMIRGKTTEQIRETFAIANDFTPEEEERVRQENQWAFE